MWRRNRDGAPASTRSARVAPACIGTTSDCDQIRPPPAASDAGGVDISHCAAHSVSHACLCLQNSIPPAGSRNFVVQFPGAFVVGHSVMEPSAVSLHSQLRLPTVYDPFTSGQRFTLTPAQRAQPFSEFPGTVLIFKNMTVLIRNDTWAGLQAKGSAFHQFFDAPAKTRYCFGNSCAPSSSVCCLPLRKTAHASRLCRREVRLHTCS